MLFTAAKPALYEDSAFSSQWEWDPSLIRNQLHGSEFLKSKERAIE
jgi:hypothetical protein